MIDTRNGKENFITIFSKLQTSQLKFFSKSCSSLTFTYVSFYQKFKIDNGFLAEKISGKSIKIKLSLISLRVNFYLKVIKEKKRYSTIQKNDSWTTFVWYCI